MLVSVSLPEEAGLLRATLPTVADWLIEVVCFPVIPA